MKVRKVLRYIGFALSILILLMCTSQFMTNTPPTGVLVTVLRLPLQYTAQWILPISIAFAIFMGLGLLLSKIKRGPLNYIHTGVFVITAILSGIYYIRITEAPVMEHNREYAQVEQESKNEDLEYQCYYKGIEYEIRQLNIYAPMNKIPEVWVIHINYGGWKAAEKETELYLEKICEQQGYAFVQLAAADREDGDVSQIVKSLKEVIRCLQASYDIKKTYLIGSSAGGHLALVTAFSDAMPEIYGEMKTNVDGVITLYAPVNLEYQHQYFVVDHTAKDLLGRIGDALYCSLFDSTGNTLGQETANLQKQFLGEYSSNNPLYQASNVMNLIKDRNIPLFFIQGEKDSQLGLEDKEELYQLLDKKAIPYTVLNLPGVDHAYDMAFPEQSFAGRRTITEIKKWIEAEVHHE